MSGGTPSIAQSAAERNQRYVLVILALCVLMLYFSGALSREVAEAFESPGITSTLSAVLLGYAYVALRRPGARTADDLALMDAGLKWGVAVGCVWLISITVEPAAIFLALLLPILCGALGAVKANKIRGGTYTGFWCGITGGLLGFLLWAAKSNIFTLFPNLFSVFLPHRSNDRRSDWDPVGTYRQTSGLGFDIPIRRISLRLKHAA
jgi:hypothetical protein